MPAQSGTDHFNLNISIGSERRMVWINKITNSTQILKLYWSYTIKKVGTDMID